MKPIVTLHGFTGSAESWRGVEAALGTETLALELAGHGQTSFSGPRFEDEVERLAAIIAGIGERVHLAGYSLGGRLALALLVTRPELFESATLIGVHPGLEHATERAARKLADARFIELLEREGIEAFVQSWQAQPLFASEARLPRAAREAQRRIRLSHGAAGLAESLRVVGLAEMPCYVPRFAELSVPIEVLVGELDTKFRALAHPGTREVVPDAGHNLLVERPDSVARAIARGAKS